MIDTRLLQWLNENAVMCKTSISAHKALPNHGNTTVLKFDINLLFTFDYNLQPMTVDLRPIEGNAIEACGSLVFYNHNWFSFKLNKKNTMVTPRPVLFVKYFLQFES